MGLLADYFSSSYDAYIAYFGRRSERDYVYVLVNNDLSTHEILKQNPAGTKEIGLTFLRSKKYHGINTSVTLEVDFSKDDYAGGTFLFNAFDNKGIRADVDCFIYRKNPATDDFDNFYDGKVDFTEKSYSHRPNDRSIKATLHEQGLQNSFLTRDMLKLDITKTKSVDGTTITSVSDYDVLFKSIDIYLKSEANSGNISSSHSFSGAGSFTDYYSSGNVYIELTGGRIDLGSPSNGQIYDNDSGESKDVKFTSNFGYAFESDVPVGGVLTIVIKYTIYNSVGTPLTTVTITTLTNNGEGYKLVNGTIEYEGNYASVPDGGYMRYYAETTHTGAVSSEITFNYTGTDRFHQLIERSNSIGDTTVTTYRVVSAMDNLMRLYTSNNSSFYYELAEVSDFYNDVVTSGWQLRQFIDKGITMSFEDLFKTASSIRPLCLLYDSANNRYEIKKLESAYQDIEIADLGKVRNLIIEPFDYYNDIKGGYISTGNYEEQQGVNEFNISHNFSTSFEIDSKLDLQAPFNLDSIAMELLRRKPFESTGTTDTRFDKNIFYVKTSGAQTDQGTFGINGFEGIEQYYNGGYNARRNIVRNGPILAGIFYKDSGESIRFTSNSKDINIQYFDGSYYYLQDDITQTELGEPYYYPERLTFDADFTNEQLQDFLDNPYGYLTIQDDEDNEYHVYVDSFETQDDKFTVTIIGKLANIDR